MTRKFAGDWDGGAIPIAQRQAQRRLWIIRFAIHRKTRAIHLVLQGSLDLFAAVLIAEAHDEFIFIGEVVN